MTNYYLTVRNESQSVATLTGESGRLVNVPPGATNVALPVEKFWDNAGVLVLGLPRGGPVSAVRHVDGTWAVNYDLAPTEYLALGLVVVSAMACASVVLRWARRKEVLLLLLTTAMGLHGATFIGVGSAQNEPTVPVSVNNNFGSNVLLTISPLSDGVASSSWWVAPGRTEFLWPLGWEMDDGVSATVLLSAGECGSTNAVEIDIFNDHAVPGFAVQVFAAENKLGQFSWEWCSWGFGVVLSLYGVAWVIRIVAMAGSTSQGPWNAV